jgi:hypothetical protein
MSLGILFTVRHNTIGRLRLLINAKLVGGMVLWRLGSARQEARARQLSFRGERGVIWCYGSPSPAA